MKKIKAQKYFIYNIVCLVIIFLLLIPGCASRERRPVILADSTYYYNSTLEKIPLLEFHSAIKSAKKQEDQLNPVQFSNWMMVQN
ncbi:MAG: hypothetical protein M5T52_20115 [Ignavibacteriaceae bacterium]|nr:hypothetical protein [Ignavibacteriaceae bacterium]